MDMNTKNRRYRLSEGVGGKGSSEALTLFSGDRHALELEPLGKLVHIVLSRLTKNSPIDRISGRGGRRGRRGRSYTLLLLATSWGWHGHREGGRREALVFSIVSRTISLRSMQVEPATLIKAKTVPPVSRTLTRNILEDQT